MKPRTLLKIHRWIALAFAPFLILQAVTGAALIFRDDLSALLLPSRVTPAGEVAALSEIVASAERSQPAKHLTRLFLPSSPDGTAFAQLEALEGEISHALIDPGNAAVLSSGSVWKYPLEAALQLHFRLNSGNIGLILVCIYGMALAVIAASGLWYWWPGRKQIWQALRVSSHTPKRLKLAAWHRFSGALLAMALLVISISGVLTGYPSLVFGSSLPPAPQPVFEAAKIDAAFALALERFPQSHPRDVRFRPDGNLAVNLVAPRGGAWAIDNVVISTDETRILSVTPHEENDALWSYTLPVHTGTIAGFAGRWLMLAAAAGLLFLAISGPLLWWRSSKKRRKA